MTSIPKSRRRAPYHHGNLPEALVAAARAMIERDGCAALTLRSVASQVGVTHAAPYRHFRDKRALLTAVAGAGHRELSRALRQAGAGGDAAVACGRAYLGFAEQHTALFRLMFNPREADAGDSEALRASFADATGDPASGDALWSLWHGLAVLAIEERLSPRGALLDAAVAASERLAALGHLPPRSARQPLSSGEPRIERHGDAADPR